MSGWESTLRMDKFGDFVADVPLTFLQNSGLVCLYFGELEEMDEFMPETKAIVDALLQRLPSLEQTVANAAFEHYQHVSKEVKLIYGNEVEFPFAENATTLLPFYQLRTIYLPAESEEGRFGLGFKCKWEEEHGLGLQFRHWEVVEVGGEAEALSFY